ncbi:hypothetical protein D3C71_1718080 [compost metagenome]
MNGTRGDLPRLDRMNDGVDQLLHKLVLRNPHRLRQQIAVPAKPRDHRHVIALDLLEVERLLPLTGLDDRPNLEDGIDFLADMGDAAAAFQMLNKLPDVIHFSTAFSPHLAISWWSIFRASRIRAITELTSSQISVGW